jgi:hypothetical protein
MEFKRHLLSSAILTILMSGCGGEDMTNKDTTPATISLYENMNEKEPESGERSYPVTLKLNKEALKDGSVDYTLVSGTADEGLDFKAQSGTVLIPKETREITFDIILKGDALDEDAEFFTIVLSNPIELTINEGVGKLTLADTDETPVVSFTVDQAVVIEGSGRYFVDINITSGSQKEIEIPFTVSGLATNEQDFSIITPSPARIAPGETSTRIELDMLEDRIPEGGESIVLTLSSALNSELGEITVQSLIIPGDLSLTDTGSTTYFDGASFELSTPNSDYPMQDAQYGLDVEDEHINTHFDGKSGRSYTKIDIHGNALASSSVDYSCVRDVNTGLTWETKSTVPVSLPIEQGVALKDHINEEVRKSKADGTPFKYHNEQVNWQSNKYTYYWYNQDETNNGGGLGVQGVLHPNSKYPIDNQCAYPNENMSSFSDARKCNTEVYIDLVSNLSTCGHKDWRLPTAEELRSIHDYGAGELPSNAGLYFEDSATQTYFSSTPAADNSGSVWCLNKVSGDMKLCNKSIPAHIKLVRGDSL